jgi:cellulose synthase operon protein YhjQ
MSVVVVASMKGGVGKTSVTANLAIAMAAELGAGGVSTIDLDPQNALYLHLGIDPSEHQSVCKQALRRRSWRGVMVDSTFGVTCLPYGVASEPEREAFEDILAAEPDWLQSQLTQAGLGGDDIVLIDTPPGPSVYLNQGFACADLLLIVLLPDAGSYSTIAAMESWIDQIAQQRPDLQSVYLMNQMDESVRLNRDMGEVLRQRLGTRLSPVGIHRDEAVSEALAFLQPVLYYDPECQAAHDFERLAAFLLEPSAR